MFVCCNAMLQNGDTALHIAAAMGRRKLTKILLESGCDKEARNKQNETAMDISRRKNLGDVISILQNPPPVLSQQDREEAAAEGGGGKRAGKREEKKREKNSGSGKENGHGESAAAAAERRLGGSKREKKRVSGHK